MLLVVRLPKNGVAIKFSAPKLVDGEFIVEIEADNVDFELKFWEASLIMYALGKDLRMNVVKQFISKIWNFVKLPDTFYHEDGSGF